MCVPVDLKEIVIILCGCADWKRKSTKPFSTDILCESGNNSGESEIIFSILLDTPCCDANRITDCRKFVSQISRHTRLRGNDEKSDWCKDLN